MFFVKYIKFFIVHHCSMCYNLITNMYKNIRELDLFMPEELKVALVADLHYYSRSLGDSGSAYEMRSKTDQKCLAESGAIIDSAFEILKNSDADAVLIAGDITNNGERVSHAEIKEKLLELQKHKPVFLIYSTHDFCSNGLAKRYSGDDIINDVECVKQDELREMYFDFGVKNAISEFIHPNGSSSYCTKIKEGYRLLGINDDYSGKGKAGYTDEHLEWVLQQIKDAKAAGDEIFAMEHHLMMPCLSKLVNSSQLISDWQSRANILADGGLEYVFVGHSHFQRTAKITTENGNTLHQINLGSLCGYPMPYTYFTLSKNRATVEVRHLESFVYDGKTLGFDFIRRHTAGVFTDIVACAVNSEELLTKRLSAQGIKTDFVHANYKLIQKAAVYLRDVNVKRALKIISRLTIYTVFDKKQIKAAFKKIEKVTKETEDKIKRTKTVVKILNKASFGGGVDREAAKQFEKDSFFDYIELLFLAVFDGSRFTFSSEDGLYKVVTDLAALPRRTAKLLPVSALKSDKIQAVFDDIELTARELLSPSIPNNYLEIERV